MLLFLVQAKMRTAAIVGTVFLLTAGACAEWQLVWEDNFDFLDDSKWTATVSGFDINEQLQYFRNNSKNLFVEDGKLKLKVTLTSDEMTDEEMRTGVQIEPGCTQEPCKIIGNPDRNTVKPVYSSYLDTKGKYAMRFGRIEVRAKLPRGDWLMPAIWMLPQAEKYGGWPRSGEIDIVEASGNRKYVVNSTGVSTGIDTVHSAYNFGTNCANSIFMQWRTQLLDGTDFSDGFHTFGIERNADNMTFFVDDTPAGFLEPPKGGFWELGGFSDDLINIWSNGGRMTPHDESFYIILNLSVGGTWFHPAWINEGGKPFDPTSTRPWTQFYEAEDEITATWDRPLMEVDYIRVYEQK